MPRPLSGEKRPSGDVQVQHRTDDGGRRLAETLQLGALLGLCYLLSICFNIYNKQVLKVFPYPTNIMTVNFAVGTALSLFTWITGILRRPKISSAQLAAILPLAMAHTMGNFFINTSLRKVAVSFTHTTSTKARRPFFLVLMSAIVQDRFPIIGGVALSLLIEASFNWAGLQNAMPSNVTFHSRNVLSRKLMVKKEEPLDNINLFSIITVMSFCLMAPVAFLIEGVKLSPTVVQSAGLNVQQVFTRSLIAALCFHTYQQVLYMILARVSPVTNSLAGNCVKYFMAIATSALFSVNYIGACISLAGVFLCSQLKRLMPKPKTV